MQAFASKSKLVVVSSGIVCLITGFALAGGHTWDLNELFSNASGTIQFIELREPLGGAGEVAVAGHTISTLTPPVHSFVLPGPNLTPPTGFRHLLFATPACAALPGFPTPNYILPPGPFFSVVADTVTGSGWPPPMTYAAGGLPTDGVHSRNATGALIACNTPTNYAGATTTLHVGCTTLGDVDGSGVVDGGDIDGFVRVAMNNFLSGAPGDNVACAEYCLGSVAANTNAFVNDLL